MLRRNLLWFVCLVAVAGLAPPRGAAADAGVRCGTRWLQAERAAGRMRLPAPPAARMARAAQTGPIEVGTELLFPVGNVSLVAATCRRVGAHAYVFVENKQWDTNGGSILQSHVDALGELFDAATPADPTRGIYQLETETFGAPPDVDGDDRIFLFILDIGTPTTVGYFDPGVAGYAIPEYRRDVLFLDETFLRRNSYLALGTLAHEFQHLIHWGRDDDEDAWVDEGLSGYAEALAGYPEADPQAVPEFLSRPYTSLTDFDLVDSARSYGVTYLFMAYLAERYGDGLLGALVAEPRNGTAGVDAALADRGQSDRFVDAWRRWIAANYASTDPAYAYAALGGRRVTTFDVEASRLPLEQAPGAVAGRWGTANILLRVAGDVALEFQGDATGRYEVWTYAMGGAGNRLVPLALDADNRGGARVAGADSVAVIVGRTSQQGQNFALSARRDTPTLVADGGTASPWTTSLAPAYPNPFNSAVRIPFQVARGGDVELAIYDPAGQRIRRLVAGAAAAGRHEALWDGRDDAGRPAASGTYLARLQTFDGVRATTLSLIR